MKITKKFQEYILNSAILIVIATAVMIFAASFFKLPHLDHLLYHYIEISRFVQRLISLILLAVAWNLYLRKRSAWLLSVIILAVSLFLHFVLHHHMMNTIIIICEAYALLALLACQDCFKRPSDKRSVLRATVLALVIVAVVFFNAVLIHANLSAHAGQQISFAESLSTTVNVLFGADGVFPDRPGYEWFIFGFVWLSVAGCMLMVLRSALHRSSMTPAEKARARELVKKYGQNSTSYLVLENDKTLFFGKDVEGVIGYGIVGGVVVALGDPVCAAEDFTCLLSEFKAFCLAHSYQCVFMSTTDAFLEVYTLLGYGHVKCGEEARFALDDYQLAGGKMAKLRAQINHANKAGLTTFEYKPNEQRDSALEKEIAAVSEQWMQGKKSGELGFTVGGIGLEEPMDRRYFYARDEQGQVAAFNVFTPFTGGYMADVTRRATDAPGGATEKLTYDGFMVFRDEGIRWGSMGLAPLANVREEGIKDSTTVKLLEFIYEKCNGFYGFRDLHHAKEKYSPTVWAPGYFVFSGKSLTPQMAYAMITIQNPGGMKDYLRGFFKRKHHEA